MHVVFFYILVALIGLSFAGLVNTGWRLMVKDELTIGLLKVHSFRMPLIVSALLFAAPALLMSHEASQFLRENGPVWKFLLSVVIAVCWCFIEGAVVLTMLL